METENDVYFTDDITYQTEGQITYNVSKTMLDWGYQGIISKL